MAITLWLQYADHLLAPTCRSSGGLNMPVGDTGWFRKPTGSGVQASSNCKSAKSSLDQLISVPAQDSSRAMRRWQVEVLTSKLTLAPIHRAC